jgi:hypothetical protein
MLKLKKLFVGTPNTPHSFSSNLRMLKYSSFIFLLFTGLLLGLEAVPITVKVAEGTLQGNSLLMSIYFGFWLF